MHVLSLPPAFVLSQDQTLRLNENSSSAPVTLTLDEVTPSPNAQGLRPRPRATCESSQDNRDRQGSQSTNQTLSSPVRRRTRRPRFPSLNTIRVKERGTVAPMARSRRKLAKPTPMSSRSIRGGSSSIPHIGKVQGRCKRLFSTLGRPARE